MSGTIVRFPGISIQSPEFPGIDAESVPVSLIAKAEADRRKANEVALYAPEPDFRPDPQPDVDRAVLERMCRSLDPER